MTALHLLFLQDRKQCSQRERLRAVAWRPDEVTHSARFPRKGRASGVVSLISLILQTLPSLANRQLASRGYIAFGEPK